MLDKRSYSENIVNAYRAVSEWIVRGLGQPPLWPRDLMEWCYYLSRFFPCECYQAIHKLKEAGFDDEKIALLFGHPSSIGHWLYFPTPHFRVSEEYWAKGLYLSEGVEFIKEIINFLFLLRKGDAFCQDFRNILLDSQDVKEIVENQKFVETVDAPEILRILPRLNITLWHYCMLLQGGLRFFQEIHGPYELNTHEILLIREYARLRPTEVWEFTSNSRYENVSFYEIYEDVKITVDLFGHYWFSATPSKKLVRIAIIADGNNLNKSEIMTLYKECSRMFEKGNQIIIGFKKQDWLRKWIELGYLWLKPLKDVLGEDWRPPDNVMSIIDNKREVRQAEERSRRHGQLVRNAIATLPKERAIEEITLMNLKTIYQEW